MKYAICIVPVAHVRLIPDHRAEMMNQLLFGESIKVISVDAEGWMASETVADGYKGYCRMNQFVILEQPIEEIFEYSGDWVAEIMLNDQKLMIPFGSNLSLLNASIPGYTFSFNGNIFNAKRTIVSDKIIMDIASMFLNTAYLWGGKSVFGIDCSGYAQSVFKMLHIAIPRDANMQAEKGDPVGFLQEARCGDLAFFDDDKGDIVHVGILINDHQIIHASGNVRVDAIDHEGIINSHTKKRTHHLRIIKRFI
jgi:hypothetical protein